MVDGIRKQWSKRHGAAVKQGIKKAKARKKVVKQATLALRKAPSKQAIVQRLFTPKLLLRGGGAGRGGLTASSATEQLRPSCDDGSPRLMTCDPMRRSRWPKDVAGRAAPVALCSGAAPGAALQRPHLLRREVHCWRRRRRCPSPLAPDLCARRGRRLRQAALRRGPGRARCPLAAFLCLACLGPLGPTASMHATQPSKSSWKMKLTSGKKLIRTSTMMPSSVK